MLKKLNQLNSSCFHFLTPCFSIKTLFGKKSKKNSLKKIAKLYKFMVVKIFEKPFVFGIFLITGPHIIIIYIYYFYV